MLKYCDNIRLREKGLIVAHSQDAVQHGRYIKAAATWSSWSWVSGNGWAWAASPFLFPTSHSPGFSAWDLTKLQLISINVTKIISQRFVQRPISQVILNSPTGSQQYPSHTFVFVFCLQQFCSLHYYWHPPSLTYAHTLYSSTLGTIILYFKNQVCWF